MRDKLDDIRFKLYDLVYSFKLAVGRISERTKYFTLSFFIVLWLAICTLLFVESVGYKGESEDAVVFEESTVAVDTLNHAEILTENGSTSEAFILLATHYNHFRKEYSEVQDRVLETRLVTLTKSAQEGDIAEIYSNKDLVEVQPIYKFVGVVSQVDSDPLYGVTHTISNDGSRTQEQLEVTGLVDVSVGSQVEFFGVPEFDTVASPIKVEAFVVPLEQEVPNESE